MFIMDDPEKCLSFLCEHSLVKRSLECLTCGRSCFVNSENYKYSCFKNRPKTKNMKKRKKRYSCTTKRSALKGTIFENSNLSIRKVLDLIYFWLKPGRRVEGVAYEARCGVPTIVNWFNIFREVTIFFCTSSSGCIGGKGTVVEISEAVCEKCKGRKGRLIESQWAFGGIEHGTSKLFLVPVTDVSDDSLIGVIRKWVLPGTTIVLNCWTSERLLTIEGYDLKIVYHSFHKYGRSITHRVGYLGESLFKKAFTTQSERLHNFLIAAAHQNSE